MTNLSSKSRFWVPNEFPDLLETKEKLVVATQGVLKLEVGQMSGWMRPKIAYTTLMIMIMMILTTLRMMIMYLRLKRKTPRSLCQPGMISQVFQTHRPPPQWLKIQAL